MAQVLMLEGDSALSILLGHYLRSLGHSVTIASNLLESRVWLDLARFDVVVVDVAEDVEDGLDLCRSVRTTSQNSRTRLLVVSGAPGMENIAAAAGADAFLSHPLSLRQIRDCVSGLMGTLVPVGSGPLAMPAVLYAS
ncbi:MAG TPA: response regulator [Blastocatellia bacterium]|nr:response regulator [Blastocatellia bacterium]